MTPYVRERLGAVELIELGSVQPRNEIMGQFGILNPLESGGGSGGGGILGFFGGFLSTGFKTVADVVNVPLNAISEGVNWAFTGLASILGEIPILGDIVAALLLVVNAAIRFVLALPGFILENFGKIFSGLAGAFGKAFSPEKQAEKLSTAKNDVVKKAPADIRKEVDEKLSAGKVPVAGTPGTTTTESEIFGMPVPAALLVGAAAVTAVAVLT